MSQSRIQRLRAQTSGDTCILVSSSTNIRYLCGYSGSNGLLLIAAESAYFFTDSRYALQCAQECFDVEVVIAPSDLLSAALDHLKSDCLAIEANNLTVAMRDRILTKRPELKVELTYGLVEKFRVVKDLNELKAIRVACEISTAALESLVTFLRPGVTEREVARQLEQLMLQFGAEDKAFSSIVATGSNTAIPHHQPTSRVLKVGDLLKIDFGAKLNGYHSDCTRMFVLGQPSEWQRDLHSLVRECHELARTRLHAGVLASEVDAVARDFMSSRNKGHLFTHGLGHGVGLEIHEDPFFSSQPATTIEQSTVVTIEPGAYVANQGGVRIEDTVVITEVGYENLTNFTYDFVTIS